MSGPFNLELRLRGAVFLLFSQWCRAGMDSRANPRMIRRIGTANAAADGRMAGDDRQLET
jgi:hypothetical protein